MATPAKRIDREINTEKFASVNAKAEKYSEPSKFPAIEIDLTFTADIGTIAFPEVVSLAKGAAGEALREVLVKDIYTAEDGTAAITLRFAFASAERTLTKQELAPATDAVVAALSAAGLAIKA